jgi:hypothetical protein
MSDEPLPASEAASALAESVLESHPLTEARDAAPRPEAAPESSTRGMLREAIQKVMDEISYHEREAKKHLQQAAELRKDLRDSFAFLQERRGDAKPAAAADSRAPEPAAKGKAKETGLEEKPLRVAGRKKPGAGKAKDK